jgi:hypothetical protein
LEFYFKFTVLSLKTKYKENENKKVFLISSSRLYKKCLKEKVPFHRWYEWIEAQIRNVEENE